MQKLTLVRYEIESDCVITEFACDFTVATAGDGLWGCEAGRQVKVTGICVVHNVYDDSVHTQVNVTHDSGWEIYTDSGFETAISDAVGFSVSFTEQGMQEDEFASMEC
ncbi:MAG: hypothetical protein FJ211_09890 [Ignavibacteria bacterium]|nr:hypothetical protein [Ignavibacteria bacterium]